MKCQRCEIDRNEAEFVKACRETGECCNVCLSNLVDVYSFGIPGVAELLSTRRNLLCEMDAATRDSRIGSRCRKYGISPIDYLNMLLRHDGVCGVCRLSAWKVRERDGTGLNIDHDHDTGRVRGLLCRRCNTGIGQLGDSAQRVAAALQYLRGETRPARENAQDLRLQGAGHLTTSAGTSVAWEAAH